MREKHLVTLTNQRRFVSDKYEGDTPILKESIVTWYEFPRTPLGKFFTINVSLLERDDSLFINIEDVTKVEETYFSIEKFFDKTR